MTHGGNAVIPTSKRKFAVFDIDGTLIRWQLYHSVVAELAAQSVIDPESYANISQAYDSWKKRDNERAYHQYEKILLEVYMAAIAKVSVLQHDIAVQTVFNTHKDKVYTYTLSELKRLNTLGYAIIAISGSQQEIVEKIGKYYGFEYVVGSQYAIKNGFYSTQESTPAVYGKNKALLKLINDHNLDIADSYGFGDTKSDISILEMVRHPIAFNPNKELFEHAKAKQWPVVIERKNMIYRMEHNGTDYVLAN